MEGKNKILFCEIYSFYKYKHKFSVHFHHVGESLFVARFVYEQDFSY